jgi:hypothetical protein
LNIRETRRRLLPNESCLRLIGQGLSEGKQRFLLDVQEPDTHGLEGANVILRRLQRA